MEEFGVEGLEGWIVVGDVVIGSVNVVILEGGGLIIG